MKENSKHPDLVRLLTRKEVAWLAAVSTHTIKRDVRQGLLKEIRHNSRRLRYHPDDVANYLKAKFPADAYRVRRLIKLMQTTTKAQSISMSGGNTP